MKKIYKSILLSLFFLTAVFFLLGKIFFSSGIILGGDWGLPFTHIQINTAFKNGTASWTNQGNLLGTRQIALSSIPFLLIIKLFSFLNINGVLFSKLLLFFLFLFSALSMYSLLKFLKFKDFPAVLGGIIYITTPIFFNYAIMGWQFVLFVMGLLPLGVKYFIKSVQEGKIKYAIITGIIYAIAVIQSQSIIWFAIVFLVLGFYLIKNKKTLLTYSKTLGIVFTLFFLLNAYWILGLLIIPDKTIIGSDIVMSEGSLGALANFQPLNIIRLFGGLFNFQYETVINKSNFSFLSFVLPILAFFSLFLKKNQRLIISFWLIGLVPILMYVLNFHRDILLNIPFSNIIRDFPRFTVLSSFAYVVLASFFLNFLFLEQKQTCLFKNRIKKLKYFGFLLIFIWFFSIFPWWTGELTNWENSSEPDMRLRTKVFPKEYFELENNFSKKKLDQKAFYLPMGGMVDFEDDPKFHGIFQETQDIFAGYSPILGVLLISDKGYEYIDGYIKIIEDNANKDLFKILKSTNINYFVIRKNAVIKDKNDFNKLFKEEIEKNEIYEYFDREKIVVYKLNQFLLHFYTPQDLIISSQTIESLPFIVSQPNYQIRSSVYFTNQNQNSKILEQLPDKIENSPIIEFKKTNPTKYFVKVHQAKDNFPLIFSESFHSKWKAYIVKSQIVNRKSQIANYKILDGNEEDQVTEKELKEFIEKGWITTLGNGKEKKIKHKRYENEKEKLDYIEKYKIDFISKNFQGTIQNNNLSNGKFYETWFKKSVDEKYHLMANGYANSWWIDLDEIKKSGKYVQNSDGSIDFELIIEFWPQRLFYLGLIISGITLIGCLGYLVVSKTLNLNCKKV